MPDTLRARVEEAVRVHATEVAARAVPDALKHVAESLLAEAQAAPQESRETAMTILAADAFVTWACEAVAEENPAKLAGLQ